MSPADMSLNHSELKTILVFLIQNLKDLLGIGLGVDFDLLITERTRGFTRVTNLGV